MKRRKGVLFLHLALGAFLFGSVSLYRGQIQEIGALPATNTLDELWGEKTKSYLGVDYAQYKNKKQIGKYYKVGIMGHHQVVEIDDVRLKAGIVEDFIPSTAVGTYSDMSTVESTSYSITNELTSTEQVKVGIVDMVSAMVNLEDYGKVGSSTTMTKEYTFSSTKRYATTLSKTFTVNKTVDFTTIPSDKKTYSISRVACYLEFLIKYSYTEEQNIFGKWKKINNTQKNDYMIDYYIADVQTFCYNDNTFGNTIIGTYPLETMKVY